VSPRRVTAVLLVPALVWGGATYAAPPAPGDAHPGSSGVGDPYYPKDGNGGIDVLHYDIHDRYAFRSGELSGRTELDLRATQDLSRFNLDFLLPVTGVTVDGARATWTRAGDHELRITPAEDLREGRRAHVVVEYAGKPATESSQGESNWLAGPSEVVAMNEPHMATWWFPANDHPSDKATYKISITTGAKKKVVANGDLVGRTRKGGGLATTTWRSREPMASYLAFFAAGPFKVRTGTSAAGIPWTVALSQGAPHAVRGRLMQLLLRSGELTDWLQTVLGTYPFSSTGGLITSLPVSFALENQTRPTYPVIDPDRASSTTLLVHELSHQWFGDSVAVAQWRDIWLNEGFATFMEQYWTETHGGPTTQQWLGTMYDERQGRADLWNVKIDDPGRDRIFDSQVYDRGGMAVAALRHRIGDTAFWSLLRQWVSDRAGGNGSVAEFEALAETVSGQDLDGFFRAWLSTPSVPARSADNGF
jgi:aminopeptidase N